MLNPQRRDGQKENHDSRKALMDAGVHVVDSNRQFDITHEMSMVIDDQTAFVQSLNWETKNLTVTRDYAVVTSHKHGSTTLRSASMQTGIDPSSTPAIIPISSGVPAMGASASPGLSTRASTPSGYRTSAIMTR